ncbi:thermonuclease family protein [Novosphingobium profundi]|uniref:thermonuclease family protein n=1 Tax=Novosphingobium profundi TaxID=1774954 RepID=UPI001BDB28C8|nr:thermonuclease family protein [Novosphingobium profundi]MBT0671778.1 thermonuclease family protein [Novosphingobium profundi]
MPIALAVACIGSIHDGDTIRLCDGERVRLVEIDAPEVAGSPRCRSAQRKRLATSRNPSWCDYALGTKSRNALQTFLTTGTVKINRRAKDRYGRTLAKLSVNGLDVGEYLIGLGLARPWR